jgi:hypothetical protein
MPQGCGTLRGDQDGRLMMPKNRDLLWRRLIDAKSVCEG